MNQKSDIEWPDILLPFQSQIEASLKSFVKIEAQPADALAIKESKFGGRPYWLKSESFPKDVHGLPMFLLAQINFAELPHLAPFPDQGILQFFISTHEDLLHGVDFENPLNQTNFRVEYHSDVIEDEEQLLTEFVGPILYEHTPIDRAYSLRFELCCESVGIENFQFEKLTAICIDDLDDDQHDAIGEFVMNDGHKIGGYATFVQQDPRPYFEKEKKGSDCADYSILLFQMDTDGNIMWGDSGVGNFFINEKDLKRRDFSNVLYTWDCC